MLLGAIFGRSDYSANLNKIAGWNRHAGWFYFEIKNLRSFLVILEHPPASTSRDSIRKTQKTKIDVGFVIDFCFVPVRATFFDELKFFS